MGFRFLFIHSLYLFLLFESASLLGEDADTTPYFKEYKLGTRCYYSAIPVTVDRHLERVAEDFDHKFYWLFEYSWRARSKQEELRHLAPSDEEYETLKNEITKEYQELNRLSNCDYEYALENVVEYVEPTRIPKELSWKFGVLLGFYGTLIKDTALWENHELKPAENDKIVAFYKTSLALFSYSLGFTERSPAILQYTTLDDIMKLDGDFQNELDSVDETAWMQAIQSLDHQRLEHLCVLFRSMYSHFLQQKSDLSLASHLCSMTTKLLLSIQKNPVYNLDAANTWMFKLYIDLKKWEQDDALAALLPEVKRRCLKLLPQGFTLEDITPANEHAICNMVRMRNLLPNNQRDLKKGKEITDEFEFSPVATRRAFLGLLNFFDDRARFLRGYKIAIAESSDMVQQIYNYLSGFVEMGDVPITKENALEYLFLIKLFDQLMEVWNSNYHVEYKYEGFKFGYIGFGQFYFPRTTFELRKKILKLCPNLKSYEALTVSVNPQKVKDEKDQTTPEAWVDESETFRQICTAELLENARHLSDLMNQSPLNGIIVGTRGISGAGKSTYLKKTILPLMNPWQTEALAKGILNPDTIKAALKKLQGETLNAQVHHEGYHAFQHVFREISKRESYILDKRHLTSHEILTDLIAPARKSGHSVWLFDFDISLTASICRILSRPLHGEAPCPEFEALIDGYRSIRRYRSQVLALAGKESTVSKYELYATSKQQLIAHKISDEPCPLSVGCAGTLCIHDMDHFDECLKEPLDHEIEEELSQVITDSFIDRAINQGDISLEQQKMLEKWLGLTLRESIQRHVQGNRSDDEDLFEQAAISPFNGTEWLADYPQLIEFLQCEHLLHIHGADEAGRGLHWEIGQNEKKLNPKYSPDAKAPGCKQGGIQMRVGYFIVPMDNLDLYLSEHLSPAVTRELVVRDEEGTLIGLRFFVHPDAYAHFAPLLRAGIAFVPPSQSEFMGTPLSSYNSWLMRRVSTSDRTPFIVKMGTPNGSGDIKHLFAGDDIVRSLWRQKKLDQFPDRPNFVLFKETAGLILKNISGYPEGTVDSGIVICELPEHFLSGNCTILSLSAAMSCERIKPENRGIAALDHKRAEMHPLPLIFELMDVAIQKGLVKTPEDFLKTYFVDAYLRAIEPLVFKEGYSLGGPSQNLYLVLNADNTIEGFAYIDLEEMILEKNFLESYSLFYRYANFIKLLNVLTCSESEDSPPPIGGLIRAGLEKPSSERNLYCTLSRMLEKEGNYLSLEALKRLSIAPETSLKLLKQLDSAYLVLLKRYFEFDEAAIINSDGTVPCAEKGSIAERALLLKNRALWEGRISPE